MLIYVSKAKQFVVCASLTIPRSQLFLMRLASQAGKSGVCVSETWGSMSAKRQSKPFTVFAQKLLLRKNVKSTIY